MIWYTYRIESLFRYIIDRNVAAFQVTEEMRNALVNQKGFVSYYFLDNDADWLRQLGEYRQIFKERMKEAAGFIETQEQREIMEEIEREYAEYLLLKDQVISLYKSGEREEASRLHINAREQFVKTLKLCEKFKNLYTNQIRVARNRSHDQAINLRVIAGSAIVAALFLAFSLALILVRHILQPIKNLAMEAVRENMLSDNSNEVKVLSERVHYLIEDIDQTHSELARSRESLVQSEKMAMVGRLAAGVAHSIRNPLTSVKMRLFSLSRALHLSKVQEEDFEVISEEISHIDTIVQNFLEFSRPPKLRMQEISPSEIVDLVLRLLRHRIESYEVNIKLNRQYPLPEIQADPEQLKEAIANLVINSCEAIGNGGTITISEKEEFDASAGRTIFISISDDGPGIPEDILDKVFQPFFTSKEEGTGLGLSIASRIVEDHGGELRIATQEGIGTTFVIMIPIRE